ncbi:MAG: dethiobiotin synthase [Gammaproteobacteria bacterium]|nr:dethiobiotin synthase [Gammaproteobacteria bacterium]
MNKAGGFFVAGTDTEIGKTLVTTGLLHRLSLEGLRVAGMKPVAAGCCLTSDGLRNDDALQLQRYSNISLSYAETNPYAFEPPIAPHLAAEEAGVVIDMQEIIAVFDGIKRQSDLTLVEGIGGWMVR